MVRAFQKLQRELSFTEHQAIVDFAEDPSYELNALFIGHRQALAELLDDVRVDRAEHRIE